MKRMKSSLKAPLIAVLTFCLLGAVSLPTEAGIADRSAEEYIEKALEYQVKNELNAGVIELKNAIKLQPNNTFARVLLGEIYLELGDVPSATKEFERARKLGAPTVDWISPLAQSWLRLGRFEEVLDLVRIDENFPDSIRAALYTVRGNAHRGLSQLSRAQLSFEMALDEDPGHADAFIGMARIAMRMGDYQKAEDWLAKAKTAAKPEDTGVYGLEGDIAIETGDRVRAEAAYRALADAPRSHALFQLPLANTLIQNRKFDEAIARLDDVLSTIPNNSRALQLRATAAYETDDFDLAFDLSNQLLDAIPDHLPAQLVAAASAYSLEQFDVAHRYLTEILSVRPGHIPARRLFGATLLRMGRSGEAMSALQPLVDGNDVQVLAIIGAAAIRSHDLEAGRDYLERYNELRPNDPRILAQLGMLRLGLGDLEEGMSALEEAVSINPNLNPAKLALFTVNVREGKIKEALAVARQVQQDKPEEAVGFAMEGIAKFADGDLEAARNAYEVALSIEPGDPATSANLARIAFRQGNVDEARNHLLTALEKNPEHMGTLMSLARLEAEVHNLDGALERLESAAAQQPEAVAPRIVLARIHLARGQPLQALNVTQDLSLDNSNNPALLEVVGEAQLRADQHNSAVTTFRNLVQLRPDSARAHHMLAAAYSALGDKLAFEDELRQVLEIDRSYVSAAQDLSRLKYSQENDDEAIALATDALRHAEDDPILLEVLGRALLRQARLEEALVPLAKLSDGNPDYAEAHYLYGQVLGQAGRIEEAVERLSSAIALNPEHHNARLILARFYVATKKFDLASGEIRTLKGALPENADVLDLEAVVLMNQRDFEGAATKLRRVYLLEPREDRAVRLSQALWMEGDQAQAMDTLVAWLEQNPDGESSRENLATFYLTLGKISEAGAEFGRLFSRHAGTPTARNNYAWVLWKQGSIEAARDQAERALAGAPNDPRVQDTLGIILLTAGDVSGAVEVLRLAANGAPKHPAIAFHLAQALAQSGAQAEAVEILNRLLAEQADFEERREAQTLHSTLTN